VLAIAELFQGRHRQAESNLRRSLELNRYDADAVEHMGYLLTLRGKPVEALEWIDRAIRLNPIHPAWYEYDRSLALNLLGEYAAALEAVADHPRLSPWVRTRIAASLAQLGRKAEAAEQMTRVKAGHPNFSPLAYASTGVAFEHESDRQHLIEGVQLAMDAGAAGG